MAFQTSCLKGPAPSGRHVQRGLPFLRRHLHALRAPDGHPAMRNFSSSRVPFAKAAMTSSTLPLTNGMTLIPRISRLCVSHREMAPQITTLTPCSSNLSAVACGGLPSSWISFLSASFRRSTLTTSRLLAKSSVVLTHPCQTAMATLRIHRERCNRNANFGDLSGSSLFNCGRCN